MHRRAATPPSQPHRTGGFTSGAGLRRNRSNGVNASRRVTRDTAAIKSGQSELALA